MFSFINVIRHVCPLKTFLSFYFYTSKFNYSKKIISQNSLSMVSYVLKVISTWSHSRKLHVPANGCANTTYWSVPKVNASTEMDSNLSDWYEANSGRKGQRNSRHDKELRNGAADKGECVIIQSTIWNVPSAVHPWQSGGQQQCRAQESLGDLTPCKVQPRTQQAERHLLACLQSLGMAQVETGSWRTLCHSATSTSLFIKTAARRWEDTARIWPWPNSWIN